MNRKDFLKELRRELERLPFEERESAIAYYEEYLDEAGLENEADAIRGFGSPASIAAGLRAEEAVSTPATTPKEGAKKSWLVILAVFSAPIAFPLLIAAAAVVFSLFVAVASIVFAFGVTSIALVGGGIATIIVGFSAILSAGGITTMFFAGGGLLIIGIGILFWFLTYFVATKLFGGMALLMSKFLHRRKRGS